MREAPNCVCVCVCAYTLINERFIQFYSAQVHGFQKHIMLLSEYLLSVMCYSVHSMSLQVQVCSSSECRYMCVCVSGFCALCF